MTGAPYGVGIDLGTTNCALAYLPLGEDHPAPRVLSIPQLVHAGELGGRALLPSYLYLPHPSELPAASLALPWDQEQGQGSSSRREVVGELA